MLSKYRHKVFSEPYRETLKGFREKIGYDDDPEIVELEMMEEQVHPGPEARRVGRLEIITVIKSISAREKFNRFPEGKK
ncbi:transposase [Pseudomonadota bacterium]